MRPASAKPIAILGAGISGLVAAWALEELGIEFNIVDQGPPDALPRLARGCVYFHDRCNLPEEAVRSQVLYTSLLPAAVKDPAWAYHVKVWGLRPYVANSVERLSMERPVVSRVWSMNDALRFLTNRYTSNITYWAMNRDLVLRAAADCRVVSTIPLPVLAPDARCESTPLYIFQGVGGHGRVPDDPTYGAYGHVLYNVDPDTAWYRMSSMFGYMSIEFARKTPVWPLTVNRKIITSPDAEAFEQANPNIMLSGRWGRWSRGVLGHETYHAVKALFTTGRWADHVRRDD